MQNFSKKISTVLNKINVNLIKKLESPNRNIRLNNLSKVSVIDFIFKIKSNHLYDCDVVFREKLSEKVFDSTQDQNTKIIQFLYAIIFANIYDENISKKTYKIFRKFIIETNLKEVEELDFNYTIQLRIGKKWDYNIFFQKA